MITKSGNHEWRPPHEGRWRPCPGDVATGVQQPGGSSGDREPRRPSPSPLTAGAVRRSALAAGFVALGAAFAAPASAAGSVAARPQPPSRPPVKPPA